MRHSDRIRSRPGSSRTDWRCRSRSFARVPKILDGVPPVTRLRILVVGKAVSFRKLATVIRRNAEFAEAMKEVRPVPRSSAAGNLIGGAGLGYGRAETTGPVVGVMAGVS